MKINNILYNKILKAKNKSRYIYFILAYFIILVTLLITTQLSSVFSKISTSDFAVGKVADKDIIVDRDIVYIDEKSTQLKIEAKMKLVYPVFAVQDQITRHVIDKYDKFIDAYIYLMKQNMDNATFYLNIQSQFPGLINENQTYTLINNLKNIKLFGITRTIIENILHDGIVSFPINYFDEYKNNYIEIRRNINQNSETEEINIDSVITKANLFEAIKKYLPSKLSGRDIETAAMLVEIFTEENCFFDEQMTETKISRAHDEIVPVTNKLVKGERIVKKGFIISEKDMLKIKALGNYSAFVNINIIIGTILYILLAYMFAHYLFVQPVNNRNLEIKNIYLLIFLSVFFVAFTSFTYRFTNLPVWLPFSLLLPVPLIAMTVSILISPRSAVFLNIFHLILIIFIPAVDIKSIVFMILTGTFSSIVVTGAEKRIQIIKASIKLALINIVILFIIAFIENMILSRFFVLAIYGFFSAFAWGIIFLGVLPIFEYLLNTPTKFRLIELSDLNTSIMKKMLVMAPGTYNHSMNVANLAESACREIGANALLARVGAYYHDIGKIEQSEYFVENQTTYNKHDELKPSLSVAVIKSHVKIGAEKAKELNLPKEVIDIITQHHGNGLISFFYNEALKKEKNENVKPEDFSYTELPPQSREAAVVMMADIVEASSRTLKKPSIQKLEKLVWGVITDKFNSGQFNECDLKFRDLDKIKNTFVHILSGQYHSRIEYPKLPGEEKK